MTIVAVTPSATETLVNTTTADNQGHPAVAALSDGGYVVAWTSQFYNPGYSGHFDVYTQRYNWLGEAVGSQTLVNNAATESWFNPAVAVLANGDYVVTWTSNDSSGGGIYAQRFDELSNELGGQTRVNTTTAGGQSWPAMAALSDGGYVVTWWSYQDGSGLGIYAQRYDSLGHALGGETRVNTTTANDQQYQTVTALSHGDYVVAWSSYLQDGSGWGIYAQRFDGQGQAVGDETRVNTTTASDQILPAITGLADGGYVVIWEGTTGGIYAQRYDGLGHALGSETRVNTTSVLGSDPAVTALPDGGYVVVWRSGDYYGDVYSQRYDAAGNAFGSETLVNTTTVGDQKDPAVATLSDGSYVVTWMSDGQDGSGWGVYSRMFTLNSAPTIASNGGGDTATVSTAENTVVVTTVAATDPDAALPLSYSIIGGADADKFTIHATTGALSFVTAPNFELPTDAGGNNVYDVTVQVSDGQGGIDTQAVAVRVTDVFENSAPSITSNGGGATAAISIAENTAAVTTVTATDPDVGQNRIYSIIGGADTSKFTIGSSTGALSFITAPNFELPTDAGGNNVYDVTVQISDGNGGIDIQEIAVTVNNVGNVTLGGGNGDDLLEGEEGNDLLLGRAGNDTLRGGAGNDIIYADADTDFAFGGSGNDQILSGSSNAIMADGGEGDDLIVTGSGSDYIWGGNGNDTISGGGGGNFITGGDGNDSVTGGNATDYLYGEGGNDTIDGKEAADLIAGGDGNDLLIGGLGSDFVWGQGGTDYFDLRLDLKAGDFDYIGDLGSTDRVVLPNGYQPYVTYSQYFDDVIGSVDVVGGTYNFWVDGGATPLTVAQVEAQTLFF